MGEGRKTSGPARYIFFLKERAGVGAVSDMVSQSVCLQQLEKIVVL